jgi:hypothetical protein
LTFLGLLSPQSCLSHFCNIFAGNNRRKAILVFSGKFKAPDSQVPQSLLYLAASLQEEDFTVRILDMRLEDYRRYNIGNPVFVGISCMSGCKLSML